MIFFIKIYMTFIQQHIVDNRQRNFNNDKEISTIIKKKKSIIKKVTESRKFDWGTLIIIISMTIWSSIPMFNRWRGSSGKIKLLVIFSLKGSVIIDHDFNDNRFAPTRIQINWYLTTEKCSPSSAYARWKWKIVTREKVTASSFEHSSLNCD